MFFTISLNFRDLKSIRQFNLIVLHDKFDFPLASAIIRSFINIILLTHIINKISRDI